MLTKIYDRLENSISLKLFTRMYVLFFIISIIISSLLLICGLLFLRFQAQDSLNRTEQLIKPSLIISLKNQDLPQIKSLLMTAYNNPYVVGVVLEEDLTGKAILQIGNTYNEVLSQYEYSPALDISIKPQKISSGLGGYLAVTEYLGELGTLKLFTNYAVLIKTGWILMLLMAIQFILLSIILWQLFIVYSYRYISKPLADFINVIQNINSGKVPFDKSRVNIVNNSHTDLDILLLSFNTMMDKLHNSNKQLAKTKVRLDSIINAMPTGLIGLSQNGVITIWNANAEQITAVPMHAAIGKHIDQVYPFLQNYWDQIQSSIRERQVKKNYKINNNENYYDIVIFPVLHEEFVESGILIEDVTAKVRMEEIIVQNEKMTSVGVLASGVAHEINNPLGTILQDTQNIIRRIDPGFESNQEVAKNINLDLGVMHKYLIERKITDFLDKIKKSGERAANIVNNLLSFSRKSKSEKTEANLAQIVDRVLELASMDFKKIKITKNYYPDIKLVYICVLEIEQVILNLINNASQALNSINKKDPEIKITIANSTIDDNYVELIIEDNGPGISASNRRHIFEPFFTTKPVGQGTGLGLSLSYNLVVDKNKGNIQVESIEGQGARFIINLPILTSDKISN